MRSLAVVVTSGFLLLVAVMPVANADVPWPQCDPSYWYPTCMNGLIPGCFQYHRGTCPQ